MFGKNYPHVHKITHGNYILDISKCPVALKIKSMSPKFNQLSPFSQQYIYAFLVNVHRLVQKIMHGKEKADANANADGIRTNNNIQFEGQNTCQKENNKGAD